MPPPPKEHSKVSGDLAVITCHFNWQGFTRPRQNLMRFIRQMRSSGVPVFGVEAVLPNQKPATSNIAGWRQVQANENQMLFQKECMLNMAEKLVPEHFQKIAWLDADIMFSNQNWCSETSLLLDHFSFVQPFEQAVWTDMDGAELFRKPSTMRMRGGLPMHSHPGFAMSARRALWRELDGLFEHLIVGNGDVGIATAILDMELPPTQTYSDELLRHYQAWRSKVTAFAKRSGASFTRGVIWHEWHGSLSNRRYVERNKSLLNMRPDYVVRGKNGLLEWSNKAPEGLKNYVSEYFSLRDEDGLKQTNNYHDGKTSS